MFKKSKWKIFSSLSVIFFKSCFRGEKDYWKSFFSERILPYAQVLNVGDKKSGGKFLGEFTVQNVLKFKELNSVKLEEIKEKCGKGIYVSADQHFWKKLPRQNLLH